ncbi:MAG: DUF1285 domain-containing protein [Alphaproteobacteria bacterium]|nr:DUF1285 domain-containing protein [Alphaproteobacteria bacterium]
MKERSPNPAALAKHIRASGKAAGASDSRAPAGQDWPDRCGQFDIRIDRNGTWFYQGSPITRMALVRLFATVLRRDAQGDYWLVTPVEAGRIEVEDVPFTIVEASATGSGRAQIVTMRTNLDHNVIVDRDHPIRLEPQGADGSAVPYVTVRNDLEARVLRPVFYHLVELGEPAPGALPSAPDTQIYGIWSSGSFFPLGSLGGTD